MKTFNSPDTELQASLSDTFTFLSDFRNFQHVMPAELGGWEADQDHCSFDAPMIGKVSLKYGRRETDSLIEILPAEKLPIDLNIHCHLFHSDGKPHARITLLSDLGAAQGFLFSRILQNLADMMAKHLGDLRPGDMGV